MSDTVSLLGERLNRGLTSVEAAEQIGVSPFILRRAEDGNVPRSISDRKRIADYYGFKVTDIWPVGPTNGVAA